MTGGLSVRFRGDGWRLGGSVGFDGPREEIRAEADRPDRLAAVLDRLDEIAASGDPDAFAAGFLSYEAGVWLEGSRREFRPPDRTPLALFGVFRRGSGVPLPKEEVLVPGARGVLGTSSLDRAGWTDAVGRIREAIGAGDVYQVNLTRRIEASRGPGAEALAGAMWGENPVPYAVHLRDGDLSIVCNSPELFLEVDLARGVARSAPIKGTAARAEVDGALARLLASAKDRAEHLMIVDLVRNDLGRVASPGGVSVPVLFGLKELRHLVHMESIVEAKLPAGTRLSGLLRAAFPPGSVTGAPKRAALGFIRRLEPVPRGPYCGAAGWVSGSGEAVLNVAIRTAVVAPGIVRYHAGGGIVWDSDPSAEWDETLVKSVEFLRGIGVESAEG